MASPAEFKKRMGVLGANVARGADKLVRKVAMAADQTVVMATPVDTGRARANWIANLNFASTLVTNDKSPSGAESLAAASAVIGGYKGGKGSAIHLTNNLSYIGPLNDGSSRQAPAGFVRRAVVAAVGAIEGAEILKG